MQCYSLQTGRRAARGRGSRLRRALGTQPPGIHLVRLAHAPCPAARLCIDRRIQARPHHEQRRGARQVDADGTPLVRRDQNLASKGLGLEGANAHHTRHIGTHAPQPPRAVRGRCSTPRGSEREGAHA